ncbi:MAG: CBS domain-containing protein [Candidatus Competibacteraceae bacterium]|jgi:predicted transcriptional regulator|nr:CBS domain-containing protein [Candidatus Competibacteraceae bacterium]
MNEQPIIRVSDVMDTNVVIVERLLTVQEALHTMKERKVAALIVNRRDMDDEYGMVVLSDISKKVLALDRSPKRVNIYEIMAKPVISVRASMDIRYCARLFNNFGLNFAPVLENEEIVGVVSNAEIALRSFLDETH